MRRLLCLVGLHSWQLLHIREEGSGGPHYWRKCRLCGKERWPPDVEQGLM